MDGIRPARPEDAPAIRRVIEAAYAEARARIAGVPDVAAGIGDEIAAGRMWVLEEAGGIVGIVNLWPGDVAVKIMNVAVDPHVAGGGRGRKLMAFAQEWAQALAVPRLELTTHAEMAATLAFYDRLGWRVTGRDGVRVSLTLDI